MKINAWLLFAIICTGKISVAQQTKVMDVRRYIFDVEINDRNDSIRSIATIQFNLLQSSDNISLDLVSQKPDGMGMKIMSVTGDGKKLDFTHANDILRIRLSSPGIVNQTKEIQVQYRGVPADGLIIAKNKYGHRTFFSDHWPNRARHWLACVDDPSDKAAVEFKVTAPLHYQVISNGVMIEETNLDATRKLTHYREDNPLPMKIGRASCRERVLRSVVYV